MQKCPICHEDFEPEDAYDHFYRHLLEVGHPPDKYDKFIDFWNMVND